MTSTAAIAGFSAMVMRGKLSENRGILLAVSVLAALLVTDDVFMLHEKASRLGELVVVGFYGLLALTIWFRLNKTKADYDLRGLKVAFYFLGLSVVSDAFKIHGPFADWLEDFSKLSGFTAWFVFWSGFAAHSLKTQK